MVSDFHGGKPVCVRKPHLIKNQDDSTQFICQGKQIDNSARVGLVASTALKMQSTLSVYHQDDDNKMNRLRVKQHLLTNARGDVAPACYCFAGQTEYEMPDDEFINERLDVAVAVTVPVTSRIHLSGLNFVEIKPSDIMKDRKG